jgi:hypothetical protein
MKLLADRKEYSGRNNKWLWQLYLREFKEIGRSNLNIGKKTLSVSCRGIQTY